jgi:hypothetical protein
MLILSCVFSAGSWARSFAAEIIIDVDFNDGQMPASASVIDDGGSGVQVVASAGGLNDTPLLLTGTATELASVTFYFPQVTEGRYLFSWDSLVLIRQSEDKDIYDRDQSFVDLGADHFGMGNTTWSLEYDSSGQMLLGCCSSFGPVSVTQVGSYVPEQPDHFELYVDLESNRYSFKVNGQTRVPTAAVLYPAVNGIGFRSPGRFFLQDPAPLAVDNILVQSFPEPATIALAVSAGVVVALGRRRLHGVPAIRNRCTVRRRCAHEED